MNARSDAAWAKAALEFDLDVAGRPGSLEARRTARASDVLTGVVDAYRVRVERPTAVEAVEPVEVEIELLAPLLLGARITIGRVGTATPRATLFDGIDGHRVRALVMTTHSGSKLLGDVRERDHHVVLHDRRLWVRGGDDVRSDSAIIDLVRHAVGYGRDIARARAELGLTPWEARFCEHLAEVARRFRLDVDATQFRAAGAPSGIAVDVALVADTSYRLDARVALRTRERGEAPWLRERTDVERSFPMRHFVGRAHSMGDGAFDGAFVLEEPPAGVAERLTTDVRAALVALAELGDVHVSREALHVRTNDVDVDVGELLSHLFVVEAAFAPDGVESPYR